MIKVAHRISSIPHKEPVKPMKIFKKMDVSQFINVLGDARAFNAGRLYEAARIYKKILTDKEIDITLTLAGAMVPAGLHGIFADMIKNNFIDAIYSTGANIFHDLHISLGHPFFKGDFREDDKELRKVGLERIYDVLVPAESLMAGDVFTYEYACPRIAKECQKHGPLSTAEFHYFLGKYADEYVKDDELKNNSILVQAYKSEVPIFCPSPGDSTIGMDLARYSAQNSDLPVNIDPNKDVLQTAALVYVSKKTAGIEIGGGAPKNFFMQTQPMIQEVLGLKKAGHDYFIQITTDSPQWGGLSGATPQEAISWGKLHTEARNVVVYCDATIAMPLIYGYALNEVEKREEKRLFSRINNAVEILKSDFKKGLSER